MDGGENSHTHDTQSCVTAAACWLRLACAACRDDSSLYKYRVISIRVDRGSVGWGNSKRTSSEKLTVEEAVIVRLGGVHRPARNSLSSLLSPKSRVYKNAASGYKEGLVIGLLVRSHLRVKAHHRESYSL